MKQEKSNVDQAAKKIVVFIKNRIERQGLEPSGASNYYFARVTKDEGLLGYHYALLDFLCTEQRIFHVGVGFGTLTAVLAARGADVVGFECYRPRFDGAVDLKKIIAPKSRYELRQAMYPDGMKANDLPTDATLLFTNFGALMDDLMLSSLIASFKHFRRVILDLRLFGRVRDTEATRKDLADRLTRSGYKVLPILSELRGNFFVEITPERALSKVASSAKSGQRLIK